MGSPLILSGHQPCYLGSLGQYAKMAKSDFFMHCGHLQFCAKSWHHRNYIRFKGERFMLSVPITGPSFIPIRDASFKDDYWKKDHLETIAQAYGDAPFFDDYYPQLKEIIYYHPHSLERLNIELTDWIAGCLDVEAHIVDSACWHFNGDAVDMIIQMCQAVNADAYLSNTGSRAYIGDKEEERLSDHKIRHMWIDFKDPDPEPYSAIHHLFNLGPEAARLIQ